MSRALAGVAVATVALGLAACGGGGDGEGAGADRDPNIVVIMTDDQTAGSVSVMPSVRALIGDEGVTFVDSVVSYPLCCPSRATYLTGQYAHNHGILDNVAPWGGFGVFRNHDTTFPVALQEAGYETIHIGKYLNGYGVDRVTAPSGWSDWHGAVDPSAYRYFGYDLHENGTTTTYGDDPADYQTDRYTDLAVEAIEDREGSDEPFFLDVAYLAPHAAAEETTTGDGLRAPLPAPRHEGTLAGTALPEPGSFDEADVEDKPEAIRGLPRLTDDLRATITANYRLYLESLLAVDEGVARIIEALEDTNQLDGTVVIFTSDNGFFFGEHRVPAGKARFYEPAIRVPLLLRGPGVPAGVTRDALVANIDLAPTILDLAGAEPLRTMDGSSLLAVVDDEGPGDRAVLLELGNPVLPSFGVRTSRYAYFEYHTGERELYDLVADPDQLDNLAGRAELAPVEADLAAQLSELRACAGRTCRGTP